jgi:prepilin-type N-terminal cleavage/methylation domain-containing protein
MNKQRGVGLIEMLVVLAIMVVLTAAIGQSLQSVVQSRNESNVSAALLAFQTAEASHMASYQSYASPITALSTCPAAGSKPTSAQSCLLPSAYTASSAEIYNYALTVTTPADAPECSTAPCGFLIVARAINTSSGRFTYCADADGVLHGEIRESAAITTMAECGALPVITAGTPSTAAVTSPPVLDSYNNCTATACSTTLSNIPSGAYVVIGEVVTGPGLSVTCSTSPASIGFDVY